MDSADSDSVRATLQVQGRKIHHQQEQLTMLRQEMPEMVERQKRSSMWLVSNWQLTCILTTVITVEYTGVQFCSKVNTQFTLAGAENVLTRVCQI